MEQCVSEILKIPTKLDLNHDLHRESKFCFHKFVNCDRNDEKKKKMREKTNANLKWLPKMKQYTSALFNQTLTYIQVSYSELKLIDSV